MTTEFKQGDRIKATCGESVIVGTLDYYGKTSPSKGLRAQVFIDGDDTFQSRRTLYLRDWTLEKILPPEPERGTLILFTPNDVASKVDAGLWVRRRIEGSSQWDYLSSTGDFLSGANWRFFHENGAVEVLGRSEF